MDVERYINEQTLEGNLQKLIQKHGFTRFEYIFPDEYRVDRQMEEIASRLSVPLSAVDSEHFLTKRDEVRRFFQGKKRFLMESFYRHMRRRHNILLEDGRPVGGAWNFDRRNRNRYDGAVPIPPAKVFENDVSDIAEMIARSYVKTIGDIKPDRFVWPVNRDQALEQLEEFVHRRLPYFGTYQDSMTSESEALFHSRLSFALNTKMIHLLEVIRAATERALSPSGTKVGIEQLEGFVRQILGWREYVRGVYWAHMPGYQALNYFGHRGRLLSPDGPTQHPALDKGIEEARIHDPGCRSVTVLHRAGIYKSE